MQFHLRVPGRLTFCPMPLLQKRKTPLLQMHISFQLICRQFLQSLKATDLENSDGRTGIVAERCLLHDVIADAIGKTYIYIYIYEVRGREGGEVCVRVWLFVCVCVRLCAFVHVCACTCVRVYMCVRVYT